MKKLWILMLVAATFSCTQQANQDDIEKRLKETMQEYMEKSREGQMTQAKYDIEEVVFFPGKEYYECEYKIHMKTAQADTTGYIKARVSYDFKKVLRRE